MQLAHALEARKQQSMQQTKCDDRYKPTASNSCGKEGMICQEERVVDRNSLQNQRLCSPGFGAPSIDVSPPSLHILFNSVAPARMRFTHRTAVLEALASNVHITQANLAYKNKGKRWWRWWKYHDNDLIESRGVTLDGPPSVITPILPPSITVK